MGSHVGLASSAVNNRPPTSCGLVFAGEGIWPTGETNELDNRIIGKAAASLTSGV